MDRIFGRVTRITGAQVWRVDGERVSVELTYDEDYLLPLILRAMRNPNGVTKVQDGLLVVKIIKREAIVDEDHPG